MAHLPSLDGDLSARFVDEKGVVCYRVVFVGPAHPLDCVHRLRATTSLCNNQLDQVVRSGMIREIRAWVCVGRGTERRVAGVVGFVRGRR